MQALNVVSIDARQAKVTTTCHTPEAAAREMAHRRSLMHTGVKTMVVNVDPLPADAMTRRLAPKTRWAVTL